MDESRIIMVRRELDIVTARLLVRRLARAKGFDIADQARISLASSSLAYTLGLGGTYQGRIAIDCLSDGARLGLRVVCTRTDGAAHDLASETLDEMRFMVDEMTVETMPDSDLRVTLIKWLDGKSALPRT